MRQVLALNVGNSGREHLGLVCGFGVEAEAFSRTSSACSAGTLFGLRLGDWCYD
jgi:hypothetical protein